MFVFFKQKTAYDMRISDWSSDVCSSDRSFGAPACGCGPNSRRIRTGGGRSWTRVGRDRMRIYRTPDERFAGLPDWPYAPNYRDTADGLRVHYVDEGAPDAQPVLMLHGEPTWGYLYRRMIGPLVDAGFRAVEPDLIGFGRSAQPPGRAAYRYSAAEPG